MDLELLIAHIKNLTQHCIVTGDLNMALDGNLDTLGPPIKTHDLCIGELKELMAREGLTDQFRQRNPTTKSLYFRPTREKPL